MRALLRFEFFIARACRVSRSCHIKYVCAEFAPSVAATRTRRPGTGEGKRRNEKTWHAPRHFAPRDERDKTRAGNVRRVGYAHCNIRTRGETRKTFRRQRRRSSNASTGWKHFGIVSRRDVFPFLARFPGRHRSSDSVRHLNNRSVDCTQRRQ